MKSWRLEAPFVKNLLKNKIAYRRIGEGKRKLLFFHGFPGSSAQISAFFPLLKSMDLEVVCIDRPGYGSSSSRSKNQFEAYEKSCRAIIKELNWKQYELVAVSGGTPFAFYHYKSNYKKIKKFSVISGLGPIDQKEFRQHFSPISFASFLMLPKIPNTVLHWASHQIIRANAKKKRSPIMNTLLPISIKDADCMKRDDVRNILILAIKEAFEQKGVGPQLDARSYTQEWWSDVFADLSDKIHFWHGTEDRILYPQMATQFSKKCKKAKVTFLEQEGHYSLMINQLEKILK